MTETGTSVRVAWRLTVGGCLVATLAIFSACAPLTSYRDVRHRDAREGRIARLTLPWGSQWVHVERWGPPDHGRPQRAEPLVLLHGFGASSWSWRLVAPVWAADRSVIAPDLSGFGFTERVAAREAYRIEGQAALVLATADAAGFATFDLVGHSYGGGLAQWIAARHPERVRRLVLIDSTHPTYADRRRSPLAQSRTGVQLFVRAVALKQKYVRRSLERSFHDPSLVTEELVAGYLDRLRVEGVALAYRGLTAPRRTQPLPYEYADVRARTFVLWGAEDRLISAEEGARAAALLPNATFLSISNTGHIPMEERPAETARLVLEFLNAPEDAATPSRE